MGRGFVAAALALMALKLFAWLAVVRLHAPMHANALYVLATALMLWSYAEATRCLPVSSPPTTYHKLNGGEKAASEQVERYCERCDRVKPAHVHHCSVCVRCVYRMDHHCPWTGNCVGWSNKKFFLLFLLYTSVSCLTFNAMTSPLVWRAGQPARYPHYDALLTTAWFLSLAIGLLLACYFGFHLWLLRRGQTTLEFLSGKPGELHGHSFRRNLGVYFGRDVGRWWLPVAPVLDANLGGDSHEQEQEDTERHQLVV